MNKSTKTTILLLASTLAVGCSVEATSSDGPGGAGGKADEDTTGLHVRAVVTELGPDNRIKWPEAVDPESDVDDEINDRLGFTQITGMDLAQLKREWAAEGTGPIVAADFKVPGNLRGVLSVAISYETYAAYSETHAVYRNFDSLTGGLVAITDILDRSTLPALADKLDEELRERIRESIDANEDAIASGEVDIREWDALHVTAEDLAKFSVTPKGITFHWDAGFSHVNSALEPDGEFEVSMFDLEDFISADGLWAEEY